MFDCGNDLTQDEIQNGCTYQLCQTGAIVNNGLNITFNQHFYTGLEAGFGYTFINHDTYYADEHSLMLQASVKLGYRF